MTQKERPTQTPFQAVLSRLTGLFRVGYEGDGGSKETGELQASRGGESGAQEETAYEFVDYTYEHSKADFVVQTGLTPEEMVLELVEENDGRMRQKEVVELVGWSGATVSRLLQDMESDKLLNRFQLGREKIICKPDLAPGGFDEPIQAKAAPKSPDAAEEEPKMQSD